MFVSVFQSTKIFQDFKNPLCLKKVFWKLLISPRIGLCSPGSLSEPKARMAMCFWWNRMRAFEYANISDSRFGANAYLDMLSRHLPFRGSHFASMGPIAQLFSTQEARFFCGASLRSRGQQRVETLVFLAVWGAGGGR